MSEEWKIQISPKTPSGTLINIRGNTPEEISALLGGVQELAVEVIALEKAFGAVTALAPLSTGTTTGFPTQPPVSNQVSASPPPSASGPTCLHGPRKFIQSKPGSEKQWSMWACPTPKDAADKCPAVWG